MPSVPPASADSVLPRRLAFILRGQARGSARPVIYGAGLNWKEPVHYAESEREAALSHRAAEAPQGLQIPSLKGRPRPPGAPGQRTAGCGRAAEPPAQQYLRDSLP